MFENLDKKDALALVVLDGSEMVILLWFWTKRDKVSSQLKETSDP